MNITYLQQISPTCYKLYLCVIQVNVRVPAQPMKVKTVVPPPTQAVVGKDLEINVDPREGGPGVYTPILSFVTKTELNIFILISEIAKQNIFLNHKFRNIAQFIKIPVFEVNEREREKCFYLTTHSTHFIYGYMASDIWLRTILIVRKETRCRHIGYSYRLAARVLLYAPSHRQDNTYHGLCYTSRGALAGTRNSLMAK